MKEEMDERNNKIQNQSIQHEDLINQISNENEEVMSKKQINERIRSELRSKKKISENLKNDLNIEKQVNERMMKSQVEMKQLNQQNEKNLYKQKGKEKLGYKDEGESSKQGTQRNQKST